MSSAPAAPNPGRDGLGIALLFLTNGVAFGSWLPWLPQIRDRLAIGLDGLGLTLAVGGAGALLGSAVAGSVVARIGSRRSAAVGALVLAAMLPLLAVAPTPATLALVLAVGGVADAVADIAMNAVAVRVETEMGRSVMSRLHGLWSGGSLLGAGTAGLAIYAGIGMGAQLAVVAVASVLTVVVATRRVTHTPPRAAVGPRRNRVALGLLAAGAVVAVLEGTPHDWGAIFLVDVTGSTEAVAAGGVMALTLGALAGRLAGDRALDRYGPSTTLGAGIGVVALATAVLVVSRSAEIGVAALTLWGLGISVAFPILYRLAGAHPAFGEGGGLGAMVFGNRLGFIAAPAVVGAGAEAWGLPVAVGAIVGVSAVLSLLVVTIAIGGGRDSVPRTTIP